MRSTQCFWTDKAGNFPWDPGYAYPPSVQQDLTTPSPRES